MNTYSVYDCVTGIFIGRTLVCADGHLALNVPEGCSCMIGEYDHLSHRVDLETGAVVDYIPPQPSPQHEWSDDIKRWVYVPTALEQCRKSRAAAYPTLQDLADALYWQAQGKDAPMKDYLARCSEVKKRIPKP